MTYIYILKLNRKTFYTGITNCLFRRMRQHHSHQSKSTAKASCIELIHVECNYSRKEARKKEVYIKNKGAKRYLRSISLNF